VEKMGRGGDWGVQEWMQALGRETAGGEYLLGRLRSCGEAPLTQVMQKEAVRSRILSVTGFRHQSDAASTAIPTKATRANLTVRKLGT
jgi:hypothetical protein